MSIIFNPFTGTFDFDSGIGKITGVNTQKITVSATPPPNPQLYDLWFNIS